jgi:DNA repair protein RecN (Recombination protein N)
MLTLLRIRNYAIIDDLEIELHPGFSVMTGETGAGKSILVDAVGLALGDRAEVSAVRNGAERAEISLVFELGEDEPARAWLQERDLDDQGLCTLRRTVSIEGGSRAFINNQPVSLRDLRSVGELLVDIHGQHEHHSLLSSTMQRQILDSSGGQEALARQVADAHASWQKALRELENRNDPRAGREAALDLLRFQLKDVEDLDLAAGEPESLEIEARRLRNVDHLQAAVGEAAAALYDSDAETAYALACRGRRALEGALRHDAELAVLHDRIAAIEIELQEAGGELLRRLERLDADPARLDEIEARLARVQQIARRHRIAEADVPGLAARLREEIAELDAGALSVAELEARCHAARQNYETLAARLSRGRRSAGKTLGKAVTARLHELGLAAATFSVRIEPKPEGKHDSTGIDVVEFLVAMNPGQPAGPIQRVASGGELSRIGLAMAVVAIDAAPIPTLVFDEIDAGIGGAVAEVVGRRLREIASRHQVLCVTHLPQVASQGTRHYRIAKTADGGSSRTLVRMLDAEQRVEELSRMLGGLEITATTRAHAAEMIRKAAAG